MPGNNTTGSTTSTNDGPPSAGTRYQAALRAGTGPGSAAGTGDTNTQTQGETAAATTGAGTAGAGGDASSKAARKGRIIVDNDVSANFYVTRSFSKKYPSE
ncbi:hypothetical protein I302_104166 [Kwoniella bestiolae CBS 10118]|uniref:Uncharacterized protein n=1 Tax=Kwoniella bestiolae CBS 10118 TaxID=1296100 RepID=A0A1B9GAI3_9TREE|nr:hypothetical protein I302_02873 [Kwoniella bestiolae CBS 10118]OCF28022.1 hypothetical protein I302_02873 [Kwoniella bestiolae CBS 10118]